jgi:hypothetical protein
MCWTWAWQDRPLKLEPEFPARIADTADQGLEFDHEADHDAF